MLRLPGLVFVLALVLTGCKTLVVPLVGTQVGRPSAAGSKFGLRATAGATLMPTAQDVAPEVRDPDGYVINPVPGDEVRGADGEPLRDSSGQVIKEAEVIPYPTAEIGIAFAERFEIGIGAHRGVYLLWDAYRDQRFTFTVSPAYATADVSVGAKDLTVRSDEAGTTVAPGEDTKPAMEAHLQNFNLTALGSVRFGDPYFYALSLYAGLGVNNITVRVKDSRSNEDKTGSTTAPTALFGINMRLAVFDVAAETQITSIEQRDGKTRSVGTFLAMAGLKGDWY